MFSHEASHIKISLVISLVVPVVKNPSANAGDMGLSPGLRRFHVLQSN